MPRAQQSVNSGSPDYLTATIASGASLSAAQKVDGKLVGIIIPSAWTSAGMTFQASHDGTTFADVWDSATGTAAERTIASGNIPTSSTRFLALSLADWIGVNFVKVRSGTSGSPVNQGAARSVILVTAG